MSFVDDGAETKATRIDNMMSRLYFRELRRWMRDIVMSYSGNRVLWMEGRGEKTVSFAGYV